MSAILYTYVRHEDEQDFCSLELRTLFQEDYVQTHNGMAFVSDRDVKPGRSPFIKERLQVMCNASNLTSLAEKVAMSKVEVTSFKVQYVKTGHDVPYAERRRAEGIVGLRIAGKADMRNPSVRFGIAKWGERWLFGPYQAAEAVWLRHANKPQQYSTALDARTARALVNIAVPASSGKLVDPCCGIGTVLLEALSLGMEAYGFDWNALAVRGARRNLAYFGYPDVVQVADIRELNGQYDAAILDLPYNVLTKQSASELRQMLVAAQRLTQRAVIVSTTCMKQALSEVGWRTIDQCVWRKSSFIRYVYVCEHNLVRQGSQS